MVESSIKDEILVRRFLHVAPSPILFCATRRIARFDVALRDLVSEMYQIMYEQRGVGLAAPQVGESLRVAVIDLQGRSFRKEKEEESQEDAQMQAEKQAEEDAEKQAEGDAQMQAQMQAEEQAEEKEMEDGCREAREPFAMVNPEIVRSSEDRRVYEEGCLSFPDLLVEVERPRAVEVRYWNLDGVECFVKASGLLSVCLQHEIDHLEGRTIVASLSRLKRSMVLRRFAKQAREEGRRA